MRSRGKLYCFLALLLIPVGCTTQQSSLPPAPAGFQWYTAKNGAGDFLMPTDWVAKEEDAGKTRSVFIAKSFDEAGRFTTGFTVNQFRSWSESTSTLAAAYAPVFISKINSEKNVIKTGAIEGNSHSMYFSRVRGNNGEKNTIIHYLSIGMDSSDTWTMILFEAPEEDWEKEFDKGRVMLNLFFLGT
ncbi:MAG: hypothetical protein QNJ67_16985 [Kiloniellales bacterium]|nr:hypothetical protein [Kiloniellales bacterium]